MSTPKWIRKASPGEEHLAARISEGVMEALDMDGDEYELIKAVALNLIMKSNDGDLA